MTGEPGTHEQRSTEEAVRITIITAVKNAGGLIRGCLRSLDSQDYPCEHIIVDGNSTDDTLEIIAQERGPRSGVISEPDNGMYDALNKGIKAATGDVIGTLHADDLYAHAGVLSHIAEAFKDTTIDSVYTDLVYVDREDPRKIKRYWKSGAFRADRFLSGWMPPHPTFFVRRSVYERFGGFDTRFGTSGDYELMLRLLYKEGVGVRYLPEVTVLMRTGGASNVSVSNRLRANSNDRLAWKLNGLKPRPWTLFLKPLSKIPQYIIYPWLYGRYFKPRITD